jgi:hypothetical protein
MADVAQILLHRSLRLALYEKGSSYDCVGGEEE